MVELLQLALSSFQIYMKACLRKSNELGSLFFLIAGRVYLPDFLDAATFSMVRRSQFCNDHLSGCNDRVHILISATEKGIEG